MGVGITKTKTSSNIIYLRSRFPDRCNIIITKYIIITKH